MRHPFHALLFAIFTSLPLVASGQALVVGDSLTKEYQVEFPALYPNNPASWSARNWIELLHQRRNERFNLGDFSFFGQLDPRLTGHDRNWAFPGATTTSIRSRLASTSYWDRNWQGEFRGQVMNDVYRVVVFAGGNDVDSYYPNIYNGQPAAPYINETRDNLKWIVNYIRNLKPSLEIMLVSVPHIGIAPLVQAESPPDPVKTGRVTAALDTLNADLAAFAQSLGIGFVPSVYEFTKQQLSQPFRIGGVDFYKVADADSRPRYMFSGDGFHPGTAAQAKIAQLIVDAFAAQYPQTTFVPLSDNEIVTQILGLNADIPYTEWVATQGVPAGKTGMTDDPDGDGLNNLMEFVLSNGQPNVANGTPLTTPTVQTVSGQPVLKWNLYLRPEASEWASVRVQSSTNLTTWTDVPQAQLVRNADGSITASVPGTLGRTFVRLHVVK